MKYQSELLKEIIDKEGHITPLLHYESECIETWVSEEKGAYLKIQSPFNTNLYQNHLKKVDLSVVDQYGNKLMKIRPIEGTMNISTSSDTIQPILSVEIPVEAITQNLASFIEE